MSPQALGRLGRDLSATVFSVVGILEAFCELESWIWGSERASYEETGKHGSHEPNHSALPPIVSAVNARPLPAQRRLVAITTDPRMPGVWRPFRELDQRQG
jgi:hypothetical protein